MELQPANWKPLERLIGCRCGEFMWMWRENGLEHYKHIDSRRYLILDAEGRCYGRQGDQLVRVDFREEFQRGYGGNRCLTYRLSRSPWLALFWLFYLRRLLASRADAAFS
jgi:hypothetical protein